MPPDDNPLSEQPPEETPQEPSPELSTIQNQLQSLNQAMERAGGTDAAIAEAIQALNERVESLSNPTPPPSNDPDDRQARFEEFYTDPESFIAKAATKSLQSTLGPHLRAQAEQRRDDLLAAQRAAVEKELGEGAWEELFEDPIESTLGGMPLEMQASRPHVESAVAAIWGRLTMNGETRAKLDERRSATQKASSSAEPPALLSGSRPVSPDTLTPSELDFLASLEKSGYGMSKEEYLDARKRGGSEAAWRGKKAS